MAGLTYTDKKTLLAAALRIREWKIDDINDTEIFYTSEDETGTFRGTYKRTYTIASNQVTLGEPVQVVKRTVYEPLVVIGTFSLDTAAEFAGDGMVLRTGKIFEAGEYPDKDFSLTEQEMTDAAVNFTPVQNDIEHKPSILSGKIGGLRSVSVKGKELFGTVAIPKWLNDAVGANPIKVSLAWAKDKKRIVGNALVLNPSVSDAQIVAAFSASNNVNDGGSTVQKPKWYDNLTALFKRKELPEELKDFDPENVKFADDDESPKPEARPAQEAPKADDSAKFAAIDARNSILEGKLVESEAEKFFSQACAEGKAFPAEKDSLVAMFKQAVLDDNAGQVCFSESGSLKEGTRAQALRISITARPKHNLTSEQLAGVDMADLVVMSSGDCGGSAGSGMTEARKKKLLEAGEIKVTK